MLDQRVLPLVGPGRVGQAPSGKPLQEQLQRRLGHPDVHGRRLGHHVADQAVGAARRGGRTAGGAGGQRHLTGHDAVRGYEQIPGGGGRRPGGGGRGDVPVVGDAQVGHRHHREHLGLGAVRLLEDRGEQVPVGTPTAGVEPPRAVEQVAAVGRDGLRGRGEAAGDAYRAAREDLLLRLVRVEGGHPGGGHPRHGGPGGGTAAAGDLGEHGDLLGQRRVETTEPLRHGQPEHAGLVEQLGVLVEDPAPFLGFQPVLAQPRHDVADRVQHLAHRGSPSSRVSSAGNVS